MSLGRDPSTIQEKLLGYCRKSNTFAFAFAFHRQQRFGREWRGNWQLRAIAMSRSGCMKTLKSRRKAMFSLAVLKVKIKGVWVQFHVAVPSSFRMSGELYPC